MTPEQIIAKFSTLNTWESGGKRAPNKPLLVLFALGKLVSQKARNLIFSECEEAYQDLLREFGRTGNPRPHPEYAFYRLKNDGDGSIWSINDPNKVLKETAAGNVRISDFRRSPTGAGFSPEVLDAFEKNPSLVGQIAENVLSSHFPESLHSEILDAVGLGSPSSISISRRRDPSFRPRVLTAYGYQCAVCKFSLQLGAIHVALEAAHIKWHQAGGPEGVDNGLALCCLHHKLFDLGAFTITKDFCLEASSLVNSQGENVVFDFAGDRIFLPRNPEYRPSVEYLNWHRSEVFKRDKSKPL
jgi:putative restriction endonuclease